MKSFGIKRLLIFLVALSSSLFGEIVTVDFVVLPDSNINVTLSSDIEGFGIRTDSATTTISGNITTELDVSINAGMPEFTNVKSILFTGGRLSFSDTSFTVNYVLGQLHAASTELAGSLESPYGPVAVVDGQFDSANHELNLNQGVIDAWGTGIFMGLPSMSFDLAQEPLDLPLVNMGSVSVTLETLEGNEATYSATLLLPLDYDTTMYDNGMFAIYFAGNGDVEAHGAFVQFVCPLHADISGDDCYVDISDLVVFVNQWLTSDDINNCDLSADLYGEDCYVNFADFAVMASEWLVDVK